MLAWYSRQSISRVRSESLTLRKKAGSGLFWEQRLLFPSIPGASQTRFAISVILNIDVEAPK